MAKEGCFNFIVILLSVVTITLRHAKACGGSNDMTQRNVTTFVMVGSLAELSCSVSNVDLAAWVLIKERTPSYISLGRRILGGRQSNYALNVSTGTNAESSNVTFFIYNLIINNVTEDMQGAYTCKEEGCDTVNVMFSVEVPPLIWLEADYLNLSGIINVTQNEEKRITCKAVGGKPQVFLSWTVNGQNQRHGVTTGIVPNGVSSSLQYRPNRNDKNITCKTHGQMTVPSLKTFVNINVLYPPTCDIFLRKESLSQYNVTCVCDANPQVSRSSIIVINGPSIEDNTMLLPVESAADIYCRAENAVGSYQTTFTKYYPTVTPVVTNEIEIQPTPEKQNTFPSITIIIASSVATFATAVVIVGIVLIKRRTTTSNSRNKLDGTDTFIQHYYHLPFETGDASAEPGVKYASYIQHQPNAEHECLEKRTNVCLGEIEEMRKPEYLEIKD